MEVLGASAPPTFGEEFLKTCPKSSRTFITPFVAMSFGPRGIFFLQRFGMHGCTIFREANLASPRGFKAREHGLGVFRKHQPPPFRIVFSAGGLQQRLGCAAPGAGRLCARPGCSAELDSFGLPRLLLQLGPGLQEARSIKRSHCDCRPPGGNGSCYRTKYGPRTGRARRCP